MILICYDGSESARTAVTQAATLMPGYPAVILTVWGVAEPRVGEPGASEYERTWAAEAAAEGARLGHQVGIDCTARTRRRRGSVADAILQEADDIAASAIIVGRQDSGDRELPGIGAVAWMLLLNAPCAVLVARPSEPDANRDGMGDRAALASPNHN